MAIGPVVTRGYSVGTNYDLPMRGYNAAVAAPPALAAASGSYTPSESPLSGTGMNCLPRYRSLGRARQPHLEMVDE